MRCTRHKKRKRAEQKHTQRNLVLNQAEEMEAAEVEEDEAVEEDVEEKEELEAEEVEADEEKE